MRCGTDTSPCRARAVEPAALMKIRVIIVVPIVWRMGRRNTVR
jgi:hypothetical protein